MVKNSAPQPLTQDIFFFHIMKTAGTTAVRLLEAAFGTGTTCAVPTHRGADEAPFRARVKDPAPCVVSGHPHHFPELWEMALARGGPRRTMTFLRHPLERFLSCYDFIRHSNFVQRHVGRFDLGLEQAVDCDDPRLTHNMMTKALSSPGRPRDYSAPATEDDLRRAVHHLRAMDVVGLVEEFNWSYALMAHQLGFVPSDMIPWNVNPQRRSKAEDIDPKLADRILEANALDLSLYAHGMKIFVARTEAAADALVDLAPRIRLPDVTIHVKPG